MGEGGRYPFERWPRMTRAEARVASRLARWVAAIDVSAALADARSVLGAPVAIVSSGRAIESRGAAAASVGASLGLVVALGAERAVLALSPGIARVIADRVVGGMATDVALGPTPPTRGESGLVGYVVARAMARAAAPGVLLDAGRASEAIAAWDDARVILVRFTLWVGEHRGEGALVVPIGAVESLAVPPRPIDPAFPVQASLVIGSARLPARELATLAAGDVVVPDALGLDPRVADVGRARLVVGRARVFELELSAGVFRVARRASIPAPRPTRWRQAPRKEREMSEPDTENVHSLGEIEVELAIELARIEMPVAEVAALAPGVVVATGRLVGERVALRAGDRVIAWGELVDVEGEVGVRVVEVVGRD